MPEDKVQCPGDCENDCPKCNSADWDLMCDECRSYLAADYDSN